jgi:hypothetical protein
MKTREWRTERSVDLTVNVWSFCYTLTRAIIVIHERPDIVAALFTSWAFRVLDRRPAVVSFGMHLAQTCCILFRRGGSSGI